MPVGDKTRDRQRVKRKESSKGKRWRWRTNYVRLSAKRQKPKVRRRGFGAGEEWCYRRGRVIKWAGRGGEDGVPRWANKRRDAKERMRQVRRREEVTLDRVTLVREDETPSDVGRATR
jgi:hypothetical protein